MNMNDFMNELLSDSSFMNEPSNETSTSTYFTLTIKKTGSLEVDKKLKKFTKETLDILKKIRKEYKEYFENVTTTLSKESEECHMSSEIVDGAIKYDFRQNKNESFISCFINYEKIAEVMSSKGFSITKEEAIEKGLFTEGECVIDTGSKAYIKAKSEFQLNEFFHIVGKPLNECMTLLDDDILESVQNGDEEFAKKLENIVGRKIIFDYFKKIGITLTPKEILDSEVDFDDFLAVAADKFADMIETDAITIKMCKFLDGQVLIGGKENDDWKTEYTVDKEYLFDNPDRLWYINIEIFGIKPCEYESDDGDVSIMSLGEIVAQCEMGMLKSEDVIQALDKIGKVYKANCELAEKQNIDIDELEPEYVPHTVINGEIIPLGTVAIVSGDMELLEIPLTPLGSDVEMILTEY